MMLLAALIAAATPLPFAPPLDRPLRYLQTEHRINSDGTDMVFSLTEEATYSRDGGGYVLAVRTLSAEAKAPPVTAAVFDAGMKPFIGVTVRVRLSASGEPQAVIDPDATWDRVMAAFRATAAATPADAPGNRRAIMDGTVQSFATLPPPAREAMMKAPATALTGLAIPDLPIGGSAPIGQSVETPFGPSLAGAGAIRRLPDSDGARHYRSETFTSPDEATRAADTLRTANPKAAAALAGLRLHEAIDTTLSASSGLLLSSTQRVTAKDPAAAGGERAVSQREWALISD
jgi:hypothetical protein